MIFTNTCRGQFSIQHEINMIASQDMLNWSKKVRSKKWREEIRLRLLKTTKEWCDYKTNSCYCEPSYKPVPGRHKIFND